MKTLDFAFKADAPDESGEFEGYASTFGNVDQGGDAVEKGAFLDGLAKAQADGRTIPLLWQHDQREPIGVLKEMAEDSKGLFVRGQLLVDADPLAKRAHALLKAKALGGMSIGYRIPPGGAVADAQRKGVVRLKKIDLREISLVTMPMNIEARVTTVKTDADPAQWWALHDRLREIDGLGVSPAEIKKEIEDLFQIEACPKSLRPFFAKRLVGGWSESDRMPRRGEPEGSKANDPVAEFWSAMDRRS